MMDQTALVAAFAGLVPLMLVVMVSDVRTLKIPNLVLLLVLALFVVTGLWGLPLETFLWRLGHGVIAFFAGFLLYGLAGGTVGAGDLKLIAVLTPFVPGVDAGTVLFLYAIASIGLIVVHQIVRAVLRRRATGWKALDQAVYLPVGVALGLTIIVYMGLAVVEATA